MNAVSIYRFFTPFLNWEKEKNNLIQIYQKILSYLKLENLEFKISKYKDSKKLVFEINILNLGKIIFSIFSLTEEEKLYQPVFKMDIFIDEKYLEKNRKGIVFFLTNIFECFDGVKEKEYLIEISDQIYYKNWIFGEKNYPYFDFQSVDKLYESFKKENGVKLLENFLKKYHSGFVLNLQTAFEYNKVNGFLIFLMYLLYLMHNILYGVNDSLQEIEKIKSNQIEYKVHLDLQKQRLTLLGSNLKEVYPRYLKFLKEFLWLFER